MRFLWLDIAKGFSIILVVCYHFIFDLGEFAGMPFSPDAWYWWIVGYPVLAVFIGGAGIALVCSRAGRSYKNFVQRTVKGSLALLACATAISLVTWFLFPDDAIIFGILHLIAVSRLIGILFIDQLWLSFFTGTVVFFATPLILSIPVQTRLFSFLGCIPDHFSSFDYFPLFPWSGIFFIGMFFGHLLVQKYDGHVSQKPRGTLARTLVFLGKHTLIIYLVHQPIFYLLLWFFGFVRL